MSNQPRRIFVFGSNLEGIHGAGAALVAVQKHGAIRGQAWGLQGDSFAIPTKESPSRFMSYEDYARNVRDALVCFRYSPHLVFDMTPIGTGLAGFTLQQLEEIIESAGGLPSNVNQLW